MSKTLRKQASRAVENIEQTATDRPATEPGTEPGTVPVSDLAPAQFETSGVELEKRAVKPEPHYEVASPGPKKRAKPAGMRPASTDIASNRAFKPDTKPLVEQEQEAVVDRQQETLADQAALTDREPNGVKPPAAAAKNKTEKPKDAYLALMQHQGIAGPTQEESQAKLAEANERAVSAFTRLASKDDDQATEDSGQAKTEIRQRSLRNFFSPGHDPDAPEPEEPV